jgi:5'-nucleotidase
VNLLLTNDDGILAPGLAALYRVLARLGTVHVVAPESPQSAAAHGITVYGPVVARAMRVGEAFVGTGVEGRPADCVKLALSALLETKPDLVVSGVNDGANVGTNVLYSGTVAAAAEGALFGMGAVAVSLERGDTMDFDRAAEVAAGLIEQLLADPPRTASGAERTGGWLVNINIPALRPGVPRGVRVVRQSLLPMDDTYRAHRGPDGRDYFWLEGEFRDADHPPDTDLQALREGYVALTPLHFDLTHVESCGHLAEREWRIP